MFCFYCNFLADAEEFCKNPGQLEIQDLEQQVRQHQNLLFIH